jgi:hypothetical protein
VSQAASRAPVGHNFLASEGDDKMGRSAGRRRARVGKVGVGWTAAIAGPRRGRTRAGRRQARVGLGGMARAAA